MAACDEAVRRYVRMSRESGPGARGTGAREGGGAATREPGPGLDGDPGQAAGDPGGPAESGTDWVVAALPPPPARILDAGCGDGALSARLAGLGYQVTSIDADPDAVAAARACGVPAVQADLARYTDEPFDAVVMLLSLHHMHPLTAALDHLASLVRPGGGLILDEFAWDWAGHTTMRWFFDTAALLAAAGVTDPLPSGGVDLDERWRLQHVRNRALCNSGNAMIDAVAARFGEIHVEPVPFLARHLMAGHDNPRLFAELRRVEREYLADGLLSATGFRLFARKAGG